MVEIPIDRSTTDTGAESGLKTKDGQGTSSGENEEMLLESGPGEVSESLTGKGQSDSTDDWKYDDPRAERAHRRAQERDPSDVVELGEQITLVLKEVDYSSRPPTIMGTKEKLVIFVTEAPQDLSENDSIRAKVVDFGGDEPAQKPSSLATTTNFSPSAPGRTPELDSAYTVRIRARFIQQKQL
ncbi:hypothetical protein ACFQL1_16290 [Halomicroarcula sp. GCM10025709]|uniref:hypothetical protein n=1 Tax=Halomicroarcula sp. GCM10025709 TaxID=3252669 RepID=UPI00360EFFFC